MNLREFLKELHRRNVWKVAVAYTAAAVVLLEVLTHLFHNFEAPHWVLKVITTLLIVGLPVACLMAWGFEFKEGGVRSVPRGPKATSDTKPALPAPETSAPPSIAVLPFEDMSAEQDQQYLGNGIAEELLNALASIGELKVAARTSSFALAARGASMEEIGSALHVGHVLEGSVRRSGRKLRVTAQLIDVSTGFHLYSEAYDRAVEDIFDIQNEIAREIASALMPKLGIDKGVLLVKQGTRNLEAYNLRLKTRTWLAGPDPATAEYAIEQLRHAIALDPQYADAWGDLSYVYGFMSTWAGEPVRLLVETSNVASVALFLSPTNVIALLSQAYVAMLVKHEKDAALGLYDRAYQAGADLGYWAFQKAYVYWGPLGHYDEAIATLKEAEQQDPYFPQVKQALIEMYLANDQVAEALSTATALEKLEYRGSDATHLLVCAFLAAGDLPRARQMYDEVVARVGADHLNAVLSELYIEESSGDGAGVRTVLDRLLRGNAEGRDVSTFCIGVAYAMLEDYEQTFSWWARAVERHEAWTFVILPERFRNHPVIGEDPRFLALLKRMGLGSDQDVGRLAS